MTLALSVARVLWLPQPTASPMQLLITIMNNENVTFYHNN
ncbi:hypothetical protein PAUR_b0279 [Pseudoalteromonas aurantia 208]|uniref:Orphan protein n=1 Tax=Pseudoalteromonas aurantia 208 TaxID=1314867 RepID=A0ABR9EH18_9GAMM|nr:hypothetical protein [Pseudoalteromonas aurantia 208]